MTARTIAVTGSTGLIGTELTRYLALRGDRVRPVVRRAATTPDEISWDPTAGVLDPVHLEGVDAVVHLAGANVGSKRWTAQYKQTILRSRVDGTRTLVRAVAATGRPIRVVSASAVGYYGDRGDEVLTEESSAGTGFLAEVVRAWEAEALAADDRTPTVCCRTGLVMSAEGGAFQRLLQLTRVGLGGPLGSGRQWWPWITLRDTVRAYLHLIDHPEVTGPVNLVGTVPATQRDIVAEMGRQLGRPTVVPAPAVALRLALGGLADDVLASQRVLPRRLLEMGFEHEHATLPQAVESLVSPDDTFH